MRQITGFPHLSVSSAALVALLAFSPSSRGQAAESTLRISSADLAGLGKGSGSQSSDALTSNAWMRLALGCAVMSRPSIPCAEGGLLSAWADERSFLPLRIAGGDGQRGAAESLVLGGRLSVSPAAGRACPGSLGSFSCQDLALSPGARLKIEIDSSAGKSDRIDARGFVDLASAELIVSDVASEALPPGTRLRLLSYGGELTGSFSNAPNGTRITVGANTFVVNYMDDHAVTLSIPSNAGPGYEEWASSKGLIGDHAGPHADPDGDGRTNLMEYALDGEPLLGMDDGKLVTAVTEIPDQGEGLVVTLPVRAGAVFAGGSRKISDEIDGMVYVIEGSETRVDFQAMNFTEVQGVSTAGLPMLSTGWEYRSFRAEGSPETAREALRVKVEPSVSFVAGAR